MFSLRKHWYLTVTLFSASLSFATGCATGGAQTRHGIPAGEWQARLPTTRSTISDLAFGRGGHGTPSQLSADELAAIASPTPDDVLQPALATKTVTVHKAVRKRALPAAVETVPAPLLEEAPTPSVSESSPAPLLASNDVGVEQRYAQREQSASEQQKFRGGDAIVISASAIVVVLLIVILVLLLR